MVIVVAHLGPKNVCRKEQQQKCTADPLLSGHFGLYEHGPLKYVNAIFFHLA
jgi:hypothetical protein